MLMNSADLTGMESGVPGRGRGRRLYAWMERHPILAIMAVSLTGVNGATVVGRAQVRPPSRERLATIEDGGFTRSPSRFSTMPRK